jgi:hypothetical protein
MKNYYLIILLTGLFLSACSGIDDSCKEERYGSAIVDFFPDSLQAGISDEVSVQYIIENSCGSFVEFEESQTDHTIDVRVKLLYDGCNCNLVFTEDSSFYSFKQDSAGLYYYNFYYEDADFESYPLVVYQ